MDQEKILLLMIIVCIMFIVLCIVKRRPDLILELGLRALIGVAAMYLLNFLLALKGSQVAVAVNGGTALINGLLGLPGLIMLYGLALYYTL